MTQLTEHFTLAELIESDTATRLGIDNTPLPDIVENLRKTAELGELIRATLNDGATQEIYLTINSGYRCEALEKIITRKDFEAWCARRGYAANDYGVWGMYFRNKGHPKGTAIDFKAPRFGTPYQIVKRIAARPEVMEHIDQIIMEGTWVHVAWSDNPRHEVKTATFDANGTPSYKKGLA